MKLEFSRQIFEKYSNIDFLENPSSGSRVVPCGQTDRHDEANRRRSQFCEKRLRTSARQQLGQIRTTVSTSFPRVVSSKKFVSIKFTMHAKQASHQWRWKHWERRSKIRSVVLTSHSAGYCIIVTRTDRSEIDADHWYPSTADIKN